MPPTCPTLVHNIQTTGRFPLPATYQAHATHFLSAEWNAILETYGNLDDILGTQHAQRLNDCRKIAWFVRNSETGHVRVSANHCGLRWCPLCADAKKTMIAHEVERWLPTVHYPKMLTLTLAHTYDPLPDQIDHLYNSFRKLRKAKLMTKNITGGLWFFQIKYNERTETWHPHLHCLLSGKYIGQGKLSRLWLKITGDSKIIDIRLVKDFTSAAYEVARYCARPSKVHDLPRAQRIELFTAMHGRRLCGAWGKARNLNLSKPTRTEPGTWVRIARWSTLRAQLDFNPDAQDIYKAWKNNEALPPDITLIEYEDAIDNVPEKIEPEPPPPLLWEI